MKSFSLFLGADHAGFAFKEKLKPALEARGIVVHDLSPTFQPSDDYPINATRVARAVAKDTRARGLLVCGSGVGVAIAANRIKGIRAFNAHSDKEVLHARQDNDVNVITLSGKSADIKTALRLIDLFLKTPFSKAVRHRRRVQQLG